MANARAPTEITFLVLPSYHGSWGDDAPELIDALLTSAFLRNDADARHLINDAEFKPSATAKGRLTEAGPVGDHARATEVGVARPVSSKSCSIDAPHPRFANPNP